MARQSTTRGQPPVNWDHPFKASASGRRRPESVNRDRANRQPVAASTKALVRVSCWARGGSQGVHEAGPAVFASSNTIAAFCLTARSCPDAICSSRRGAWREATLSNARQKAVEAQTQKISKIAIGLNATLFPASIINMRHRQTQHGCCSNSHNPFSTF